MQIFLLFNLFGYLVGVYNIFVYFFYFKERIVKYGYNRIQFYSKIYVCDDIFIQFKNVLYNEENKYC